MTMADLPEKVDCVFFGTSLTNSILAASCARVGKSVLHLDCNNYYGDHFASFTFEQLVQWTQDQQQRQHQQHRSQDSNTKEPTFSIRQTATIFSNLNVVCDQEHQDELVKKSKLFCIDLAPRFIYSNGAMVELLVKSNVSRYHEFKNTVRLIGLIDGRLQVLPCNRSDVFSSKIFSPILDKRRLMKFLELCRDSNEQSELADYLQMDIEECLIKRDMGKYLRDILINTIAMVDPKTSTLTACANIKKFLFSVERYGLSPFLFPLYGCGEFAQSFCRLSALFGGVYCLNRQAETIRLTPTEEDRITVRLDGDKIVRCANLVMNYAYALSANILKSAKISTGIESRAILITTKSFHAINTEHNTADDGLKMKFFRLPADAMTNKHTVSLIEVNSSVMVCPEALNIVYLWTRSHEDNATKDLMPIVDKLYSEKVHGESNTNENCILWSCYYNQLTQYDTIDIPDNHKNGLFVTSLGSSDTDYDTAITEAKNLFQTMFPGEEFLPRAPNQDEIVFDVDSNK